MDEAQLLSLWQTSAEAEGFDVFVSHTWVTPGYQKFLSMLLSSYWHYAMAAWLLAAVPLMILYIFDVLPMFILIRSNIDDYQVDIPCGPWIFFATFLSAICGLFGAPYVGSCFCRKSRCFYDAACVNQVDPMKRERGIYGIGGFLAVSRQLRILWSPPYLSRLWCASWQQMVREQESFLASFFASSTFKDVVQTLERGIVIRGHYSLCLLVTTCRHFLRS